MDSETFCILPWIHIATMTNGSPALCCIAHENQNLNLNHVKLRDVWNSDSWKDSRCKMLRGDQVSDCEHCYSEEANGIRSHRINENTLWKRLLGEDYVENLIKSTEDDGTLNEDFITVDLRPGNRCNFQCIFCKPSDSTSWHKNARKLANGVESELKWEWKYKTNIDQSMYKWYKKDNFTKDFYDMLPKMRHIIFGGGEPFIINEHDKIIEACLPYAENIELRYHTNGTNVEKYIDRLSKFKYVEIMVSLDSIGEQNDYIRYPSKWDKMVECLRALDETPENIEPKLLVSVFAFNLPYLPEISKWVLDQKFKRIGEKAHAGLFHPGVVHYPEYLCSTVLPQGLKDQVSEKIHDFCKSIPENFQAQRFRNLVKFMNSDDKSYLWHQTIEYIEKLDELRGTNFYETFPEVAEWM